MVRFCGAGNQSAKGAVEKIGKIYPFVLQQFYSRRGDSGAQERVFGTNQANWGTKL